MKLEDFIGMKVERKRIPVSLREPHDESFPYAMCQKFYGKDEELSEAIEMGKQELCGLQGKRMRANMYAMIGNLYYIKEDFGMAAGCFMKCLTIERDDITPWIELLFCLRALGEFEVFEEAMFKLEKIAESWALNPEPVLTQSKVLKIIWKDTT